MHVLWWFDIQLSLQAVVGLVVFRYSTECSGCCTLWQRYTTMCCMVDAYWSGSCMSSYRRYHYLVPTSYSCHTVCILFWYLSICDLLQRVVFTSVISIGLCFRYTVVMPISGSFMKVPMHLIAFLGSCRKLSCISGIAWVESCSVESSVWLHALYHSMRSSWVLPVF